MVEEYKINPLSPDDSLHKNKNYKIYSGYLKSAIDDKRIKNIAVTGNYGIGKSSILKTFSKENKKKFLFLSLGEFVDSEDTKGKNNIIVTGMPNLTLIGSNGDTSSHKQDIIERQKFESSLLRQIITVCRHKDIPQSEFKLVSEPKNRRHKFCLSLMVCIDILMLLILIFKNQVYEIIHIEFIYKIWHNNFILDLVYTMLGTDATLHTAYLILYLIFGILTLILFGKAIYEILIHTKVKEVSASVNNSNAEVSATAEINEYYLEQYIVELVYVLEHLSKKYSAIVFEDMDRINDHISIEILTYLREISRAVNKRLNEKIRKRKLNFIFVMDDLLLSKFYHTKYFDYILPVVPELGTENVDVTIRGLFEYLGLSNDYLSDFIELAKELPQLKDFRTLNQIKNEYVVFKNIIGKRNALEKNKSFEKESIAIRKNKNIIKKLNGGYKKILRIINKRPSENVQVSICEKNDIQLLSFIIYKVLVPDDYNLIREGQSALFYGITQSKQNNKNNTLQVLLNFQGKEYLSKTKCLRFIGYSTNERKNYCRDILLDDCVELKIDLLRDDMNDEEHLCNEIFDSDLNKRKSYIANIEDAFMLYFLSIKTDQEIIKEFINLVEKADYNVNDELVSYLKKDFLKFSSKISEYVLKYFIRRGYKNFEWLKEHIEKNQTECLEILEQVNVDDLKVLKKHFGTYLTDYDITCNIQNNKEKFPNLNRVFCT